MVSNFNMKPSNLKIIGVSSGKGGVGKTTFSINLSAALYELGLPNIIVDGDISNANLSIQLGLHHNSITLQDLMTEKLNPLHAIRIHPTGLRILPAAISLDSASSDIKNIRKYLNPLQETLIMDFPPGTAKNTAELMDACDEIIVITTPEVTSITDSLKTIELAKECRKPVAGVVVNRALEDKYELSIGEIQIMCENHILGVIPEDKKVKRANFECLPYIFRYPYSKATIETKRAASRLLGRPYSEPKFSFFRGLFER